MLYYILQILCTKRFTFLSSVIFRFLEVMNNTDESFLKKESSTECACRWMYKLLEPFWKAVW